MSYRETVPDESIGYDMEDVMLKHKHYREIAGAMNWVRECNSDRPEWEAIRGVLDQVEMCLADVLNRNGRKFDAKAFYSDCENGI